MAAKTPCCLKLGEIATVEIEKIGALTNPFEYET